MEIHNLKKRKLALEIELLDQNDYMTLATKIKNTTPHLCVTSVCGLFCGPFCGCGPL